MADNLSVLKGTICQHCGDEGYSNAFVYCVKCLNFAVHRYCLHQIPPTFDEFVYWACEDCKQIKKSKNTSLLEKHEGISLNKEDNISLKHADQVHCKKKLNMDSDAMNLDAEKVEEKIQEPPFPLIPEAPTTPIEESEVKNSTSDGIDSQTKEDEDKTSQTPNRKPKRKRKSLTLRKKKRRQAVVSSVVNKGDEEDTRGEPSKLAEMVSNSSPVEEELKEKKDGLNEEEEEHRKADSPELAELVQNSSSVDEELKKKKDGLKEEIVVTNSMSTDVMVGDYQSAIEETPCVPAHIGEHVEEPKLEKERRLLVFNGGGEVTQVDKEGNYVPLNYIAHAKPVIDPIWRFTKPNIGKRGEELGQGLRNQLVGVNEEVAERVAKKYSGEITENLVWQRSIQERNTRAMINESEQRMTKKMSEMEGRLMGFLKKLVKGLPGMGCSSSSDVAESRRRKKAKSRGSIPLAPVRHSVDYADRREEEQGGDDNFGGSIRAGSHLHPRSRSRSARSHRRDGDEHQGASFIRSGSRGGRGGFSHQNPIEPIVIESESHGAPRNTGHVESHPSFEMCPLGSYHSHASGSTIPVNVADLQETQAQSQGWSDFIFGPQAAAYPQSSARAAAFSHTEEVKSYTPTVNVNESEGSDTSESVNGD